MNLWTTWTACKDYRCRPSELLGIVEQPLAFFFDRAVRTFGAHVERELEKAGAGKKSEGQRQMAQNMVLQKWLGMGRFASPTRR